MIINAPEQGFQLASTAVEEDDLSIPVDSPDSGLLSSVFMLNWSLDH
jgi:hypothetical protein